jgi:mercuric ion transport protein
MRRALLASVGGVTAAFLGSLCCAGPLLFVAFGLGAGLASTFEPLRPIFGLLMVVMFGVAFYTVYGKRPPPADAPVRDACAVSGRRARDKVLLWTATAVALALWTFPTWSRVFV